MAIEAARQSALGMNLSIDGYDLRQISVSQALVIPEPSGQVETMLCMKPYPESSRSSSGIWNEFFVYSASGTGEWIEHCRGHISIRQSTLLNDIDSQRQMEMTRSVHAHQKVEADLKCSRMIRGSELYAQCANIGLEYGPSFANMTDARVDDACFRSIGTVIHPDIEKVMPVKHHSPFVVHPATLDAFFHVAIAGKIAGKGLKTVAVPTFISSVFVSNNLSPQPQHEFSVYATIDKGSERNSKFSLDVYDREADPEFPSLHVHGLESTSLSGQQGDQNSHKPRKSYYRTKLRPDVSLLSPSQFSVLCSPLMSTSEDSQLAALIDEAFYYMADSAIKHMPETAFSTLSFKGVKLYRSLQRIVEYVTSGQLPFDVSSWVKKNDAERKVIVEKARNSGDEGNFAVVVGEKFQGIIHGTVDPLALTMGNDELGRYYANNSRMTRQW